MNKNMRAGYQGKPDAMREMADKLMDHPGHAKAVYFSKSAADFEKMRPFKEGGMVKRDDKIVRMENKIKPEVLGRDIKADMKKHTISELRDLKKEDMRKEHKTDYKKGGCVQKFAAGGVAKVRHDQATMSGAQKGTKKSSTTGCVYY